MRYTVASQLVALVTLMAQMTHFVTDVTFDIRTLASNVSGIVTLRAVVIVFGHLAVSHEMPDLVAGVTNGAADVAVRTSDVP